MRFATMVGASLSMTAFAAGCLPGDTRPTPGSVYVTAEPSDATRHGFSTPDGWTVTFERFLIGLGDISLENDACNSYAETHYDRLFDFVAGGRQKVGIVYGLGSCSLQFRLRSPSLDALLGEGVTVADQTLMRTEVADAYTPHQQRVSLYVRGSGSRGDVTKRFEWMFRHRYSLRNCAAEPDGGETSDFDIQTGSARDLRIVVLGDELFRKNPVDEALLEFDLIAGADADGDGAVTFAELEKVPAPPPPLDAGIGIPDDAGDAGGPTLAAMIYETLVPRTVRLEGSAPCQFDTRDF